MKPAGYISVTNFYKYQAYKDGRPIHWVKLYLSLLDDFTFCSLPDALKWPFVGLLLLAAKHGNFIPADPKFLSAKLSCKSVDVKALVESGMISYESVRDSTNPYDFVPREEKSREEKSREEPPYIPPRVSPEQGQAHECAEQQDGDLVSMGEFGHVKLTRRQESNLREKLGAEFDAYVNRFDRWADELPPRKRATRKAYNSILNWYDRDVKDGRVEVDRNRNGRKTTEDRIRELNAMGIQ